MPWTCLKSPHSRKVLSILHCLPLPHRSPHVPTWPIFCSWCTHYLSSWEAWQSSQKWRIRPFAFPRAVISLPERHHPQWGLLHRICRFHQLDKGYESCSKPIGPKDRCLMEQATVLPVNWSLSFDQDSLVLPESRRKSDKISFCLDRS